MPKFAVIENDVVKNIIVADDLIIAETITENTCLEYTDENPLFLNAELDVATVKKIKAIQSKKEADKAKAEAQAEAERIKAIEAENERLRKAEADRLAAEEASKPKPVTGIFVKVEKN
jgi:hypothetical protein